MTEPLLHLLYEDGDKTKPLSPLVDNPSGGDKIGRLLGKNSSKDISEWADMIFLLAKKGKGSIRTLIQDHAIMSAMTQIVPPPYA